MEELRQVVVAEGFEVLSADESPSPAQRNTTWLNVIGRKQRGEG
jgi:hypothetical protein